MESERTVAIMSPSNTGKTTSVMNYLALPENNRVISICYCNGLVNNHVCIFDKELKNAGKMVSYDVYNEATAPPKFSVHLNYIINYEFKQLEDTIVYLDEVTGLITYLIQSETLATKRRAVFDKLNYIITNCKQLIATDADMNDSIINYIKTLRGEVYLIQNDFKEVVKLPTYRYSGRDKKNDIIRAMQRMVTSNQLFMVICDDDEFASIVYTWFVKYNPDKKDKIKLRTSDYNMSTSDIPSFQELWIDKWVISSSNIIYGLDFVPLAAQPIFVLYTDKDSNLFNAIQNVTRTRFISELHYLITNTFEQSQFTSLDDVKKYYRESADYTKATIPSFNRTESIAEKMFNELFCYNEYIQDIFKSDRLKHFEDIITSKGFNVQSDSDSDSDSDSVSDSD